jgi:zinc/manganese transport system substrate-binding protein
MRFNEMLEGSKAELSLKIFGTDFDELERIAREANLKVGGELYSDALSAPGTAADTYLRMFEHNVRTLLDAMTPAKISDAR